MYACMCVCLLIHTHARAHIYVSMYVRIYLLYMYSVCIFSHLLFRVLMVQGGSAHAVCCIICGNTALNWQHKKKPYAYS